MGAMFRLRLGDDDRERYGCGEWLDVDPMAVTAWEAALIQRGFTRDGLRVAFDSPNLWRRALRGDVVADSGGVAILDPVRGPDGEPVLDEDGKPKTMPRRRPDLGAELILVWLALRHAGTQVPMDQVDYHIASLQWQWQADGDEEPAEVDEVPGEPEGKDDAGLPSEQPSIPTSAA